MLYSLWQSFLIRPRSTTVLTISTHWNQNIKSEKENKVLFNSNTVIVWVILYTLKYIITGIWQLIPAYASICQCSVIVKRHKYRYKWPFLYQYSGPLSVRLAFGLDNCIHRRRSTGRRKKRKRFEPCVGDLDLYQNHSQKICFECCKICTAHRQKIIYQPTFKFSKLNTKISSFIYM